ncbi:MAG: dihydrodipicolinate synthase family protein [Planctomycetota bacterium]|jgi:dihydrodipicolinate synthase/N-acetylneuraminate lyase
MLVAPIPTPFTKSGDPDWKGMNELVAALAEHVDGFVLFGSTGEAVHLDRGERAEGIKKVRSKKPLWIGVGDESLRLTLKHAQAARDAGARAVLATSPRYYAGALGHEALVKYYAELADAVPMEVWIYHMPKLTKIELPVGVVRDAAAHPNIRGIKDSSGEMPRLAYYASQGLDLQVFTGHAATLLAALELGAHGAILAAAVLAPKAYRALMDAHREGRADEARSLQARLEPLGRVLGRGGFILLKQALRALDLPAGVPRAPYPAESPAWSELEPILDGLRSEGWLLTT